MKYTIMSINDRAKKNKEAIRETITTVEETTSIEFCNGRDPASLNEFRKRFPRLEPNGWNPTLGEYGVWMSQASCWQWAAANDEDLIVLEDDAIVNPIFDEMLPVYLADVPKGWDFVSLCVPENQFLDITYRLAFDEDGNEKSVMRPGERFEFRYDSEIMARAYQGYCCVATLYSPQGAAKLLSLGSKLGLYTPVDCFLFLMARSSKHGVKAYAPLPSTHRIVDVDWHAPTTVHHLERFL